MIHVLNEYDCLKEGLVCSPVFFEIIEPINAIQSHYFATDPPSRELMLTDFQAFEDVLSSNGCTAHHLNLLPGCPYQVWTRDVAFCIGAQLLLSNMTAALRQPERGAICEWASSHGIDVVPIPTQNNAHIEGGDTLCDEERIFVGLSQRTDSSGIAGMKSRVPSRFTVMPLRLRNWVLHLDMVLNLFPGGAVWCPEAFGDPTEVPKLIGGDLFEVSRIESEQLATNFLFLDRQNVISQPRHLKLNEWFSGKGFHVIELESCELNKLGGGFRCAILPIRRED